MIITVSPNLCPVCGKAMSRFEQPALMQGGSNSLQEDCRNPNCAMPGVTLAAGEHAKLTPDQIQQYIKAIAEAKVIAAEIAAEAEAERQKRLQRRLQALQRTRHT